MIDTELYPLKFESILKEKIWGGNKLHSILGKTIPSNNTGESWEISGVQENLSIVKNGFLKGNNLQELIEIYMDDLVGEKVYNKFGVEFPLLIKFIDANDILSIQVHPDNELAKERHNAYGKTEMWYIVQADKNAEIITGFNELIDKSTYLNHLKKNTLKNILNIEKVKSDDVFFIPAGKVHAVGSGILLAEIQQTSDVTYRIYDWNRKDKNGKSRELHTEFALDAINFNYHKNHKTNYQSEINWTTSIIECDYFTTNLLHFNEPFDKDYYDLDSFVIFMCLEGDFTISYENGLEKITKGECTIIPAALNTFRLTPQPEAKLLEIYIT